MGENIKITLKFGGGSDVLFDGRSKIPFEIARGATLADLLEAMKDQLVQKDRWRDFFEPKMLDGVERWTVRAGVMVLVDESDWEVLNDDDDGETVADLKFKYVLEEGETIEFISTLHGG